MDRKTKRPQRTRKNGRLNWWLRKVVYHAFAMLPQPAIEHSCTAKIYIKIKKNKSKLFFMFQSFAYGITMSIVKVFMCMSCILLCIQYIWLFISVHFVCVCVHVSQAVKFNSPAISKWTVSKWLLVRIGILVQTHLADVRSHVPQCRGTKSVKYIQPSNSHGKNADSNIHFNLATFWTNDILLLQSWTLL